MPQRTFRDQTGHLVMLQDVPQRVVSVVPSQTEYLFDLGLDREVVGITRFCVHPREWHRKKTRVGGTKTLHLDRIHSLQPDLILANKEENTREQIELLRQSFPVWVSDIRTLPQAIAMMQHVGHMFERDGQAASICHTIESHPAYQQQVFSGLRVLYLIWREPYMSVNSDTFIHHVLQRMGWVNVCATLDGRYPALDSIQLKALHPDVVLLSSEPYPFKAQHQYEMQQLLPQARVMGVDGEAFSWYGSRLWHTANYLVQLLQQLGV